MRIKVPRTIPPVYKKAQARMDRKKEIIVLWMSRGKSFAFGCAKADITYTQARKWKSEDEGFALSCEEAFEVGTMGLEDIADNRARRRSDTLLMFLLKGRDLKYRDTAKTIVEVQAPRVVARRF